MSPCGGLIAHGADQHQAGDVGGRHGRHLGGDPAAEAQADQCRLVDLQRTQQIAMDHRYVAHAAHPVRRSERL